MERIKNIKKALAMMLIISEGFCAPMVNTTAELLNVANEINLKVEAFVVSGWIKVSSKQNIKLLERLLGYELSVGNNLINVGDGELKIVISDDKNPSISMQLVTKNELVAEYYRSFWQKYADNWGSGEIIGITLLTQAYEEISELEQKKILAQAQSILNLQGQIHQSPDGMEGVYYTPKLGKGLTVAQRELNFNMVIRNREKECDIYLASPIIYQTY